MTMKTMLVAGLMMMMAVCSAQADTVGILWFGRSDVEAPAYGPLINSLTAAVPGGVARPAGEDPVAAARELREKYGATTLVVVAHSMEFGSGIAAQQFVARNSSDVGVSALVLISGFLQRNNRPGLVHCAARAGNKPVVSDDHPLGYLKDGVDDCSHEPTGVVFNVPVLTIGGELDGVVRIGRVAEAWYTQRANKKSQPVVVVEGMTHSVILGDDVVLPNDVPLSVSTESGVTPSAARDVVAKAFGMFMRGQDMVELENATATLLQPLVTAFVDQEGSWWFGNGNDDEHGTSSWAARAQRQMVAPLPQGWQWANSSDSTNAFHLLSDESKIPPYYRGKHRADIEIVSVAGRTLRSSTVAQLRYVQVTPKEAGYGLHGAAVIKEEKAHVLANGGFLEEKDVGLAYVSAIEIGTKLASRQLVFNKTSEATGGPAAPDSLDDGNRCADINQQAYEWALATASPAARQRHLKYGIPMRMVADKKPFPPAGPWWIWNYLQYNMNPQTASPTLDVQSWFAFYSMSGLAYGAGNHYCKALSPARAMEWIYTDSLKP